MKGFDKKALRKMENLLNREDLRDEDREALADMHSRYKSPDWRFFTEKQRQYIRSLYERYSASARGGLDPDYLRQAEAMAKDPRVSERSQRILAGMAEQYRLPGRGFFSPKQKKLIRTLGKEALQSEKNAVLRNKLQEKLERGECPTTSVNFCQDVIRQFDQTGRWSGIQLEHIEKILVDNEDPADGEEE